MTPRTGRYLLGILLALCLSLSTIAKSPRQAADEATIRALLEGYFAAYAREDLEAITALWSDKSAELAQAKARLKELFSLNNQIEIRELRIRQLQVEANRATAVVTITVSMISTQTNRPPLGIGKQSQNISLVKEAEGWKIWRNALAEEELAARLFTAKNNSEREALLTEDSELLTGALARSVHRIGDRFRMQLDFEQAMSAYNLVKSLAERVGDKYLVAGVLNTIGTVLILQGDYQAAVESLNLSVQIREEIGLRDLTSIPLKYLSAAYGQQGNYSRALECAYKALVIAEAAGNKADIIDLTLEIGTWHRLQNNLDLALQYLKKGLALCQQESDEQANAAQALEAISVTYALMDDYDAAIDAAQKALAVMGNPTTGISAAHMFASLGHTHQAFGKYDLALEYHLKALPLIEKSGIKYTTAIVQMSVGADYYHLGNYEKAIEYAERASRLARQSDLLEPLSQSLYYLGLAYLAVGRVDDARRVFDEAIVANETMREQVAGGEQEREQFFEKKTSPYYGMVELLAAQNRYDEALAYAERAKGRVLLDVIGSGRTGVIKTMSSQEREQEKRLATNIASLNLKIQGENARPQTNQTRLSELKTSLEQARLDQKAFQAKLYTAHPELRIKRGEAQKLSLEQTGELLTDSKTALLEYAVTGNKTFLFVLTANPAAQGGREKPVLKLYELKIKRQDLVEKVQKLRQRLANNDLEYAELSSELYNLLVAPARLQLQGKSRLVIVPDDILWETPFQALRSPHGRFLIQDAAISYTPSLTVLRETIKSRKPKSATTLLAMGNPKLAGQTISRSKNVRMSASFEPLPDAERLVKGLAQMYGAKASKVYVGAEAREEVLKAESSNYRILQLATHGVINNASPMYSHVVLAQNNEAKEDGLLEAWEIMQMDLQADLAVLSACETARGRIGAGEGVIGLSWALFVAGCPTTVVSQWKVESSSTTELMLAFHRNLKSGASKSEALRQASLKLMAGKRYNHPFYWASFIVVGDGN